MPEETENATPAEVVEPPPARATTDDEPLGEPGKRALEAERKLRKDAEKAAAEAQALVKKFEDANKSELEKVTAKATEAAAELERIKAENLRMRVAAESGLPSDMFEFLTGTTEEQLSAQAEKLKAATAARNDGPRLPAPDPSQGAKPGSTQPSQLTRADLIGKPAEWIVEQADAGRLDELQGINR